MDIKYLLRTMKHSVTLNHSKDKFTEALIFQSKIKTAQATNVLNEIYSHALIDSMPPLIKYQIFLKHKQTRHQGDPNSWSSSASSLTDIRAPLIVYGRLLGPESFPPAQVSCCTTRTVTYWLSAAGPCSQSGDNTECLFAPHQETLNVTRETVQPRTAMDFSKKKE